MARPLPEGREAVGAAGSRGSPPAARERRPGRKSRAVHGHMPGSGVRLPRCLTKRRVRVMGQAVVLTLNCPAGRTSIPLMKIVSLALASRRGPQLLRGQRLGLSVLPRPSVEAGVRHQVFQRHLQAPQAVREARRSPVVVKRWKIGKLLV